MCKNTDVNANVETLNDQYLNQFCTNSTLYVGMQVKYLVSDFMVEWCKQAILGKWSKLKDSVLLQWQHKNVQMMGYKLIKRRKLVNLLCGQDTACFFHF